MNDFAIIAEGYTDQLVIKNILLGFFAEGEEPGITFVQPLYDATSARTAPSPGGFDQVIKYFETGKFRDALQLNRFLVVHIDTDVSEQYGVAQREEGRELAPHELISRVVERFHALIGPEVLSRHGERFLFAIAVDEIECWLLPLFFSNNKKGKLTGCREALNHELRLAGRAPLATADGKFKDPAVYSAESRPYRRRKVLLQHRDDQPSLAAFLAELERRNIQIAAPET